MSGALISGWTKVGETFFAVALRRFYFGHDGSRAERQSESGYLCSCRDGLR